MTIGPGRYVTKGGFAAAVVRLKQAGQTWTMTGAITVEDTNVRVLARWDVFGRCVFPVVDPAFDLKTRKVAA